MLSALGSRPSSEVLTPHAARTVVITSNPQLFCIGHLTRPKDFATTLLPLALRMPPLLSPGPALAAAPVVPEGVRSRGKRPARPGACCRCGSGSGFGFGSGSGSGSCRESGFASGSGCACGGGCGRGDSWCWCWCWCCQEAARKRVPPRATSSSCPGASPSRPADTDVSGKGCFKASRRI